MSERKITIGEPVLTRYERARIVGARALQISHGAPLLIDIENDDFRPHDVANKELRSRTLPIGLSRRLPNGRPEIIPIQFLEDREFITQIKVKKPQVGSSTATGSSGYDLTDVPGVGESTAEDFKEAGFDTVESVVNADLSDLTNIKGVGSKTAEQIQFDARELLGISSSGSNADLDLTEVPGIGKSKADDLKSAGYKKVSQLANASVDDLTSISGIGKATAEKYINAAKELLD